MTQPLRIPTPPVWLWLLATVLITCGAIIYTFWHVVTTHDPPLFLGIGDAWSEAGPKLSYFDHVLHEQHTFPFWNPLTYCGQPAAANPQYMVFYPPNIFRALLNPNPTPLKTHYGIIVMIFFHYLLATIGTFYLARAHGLSPPAAMVATFAFVFSANMLTKAVGHWQFVIMVSWMPINFLLLRKAIEASAFRRSLLYYMLFGVAFAVTLLGGSPQFILLCSLSIAVYWLGFQLFALRRLYKWEGAPERNKPTRWERRRLLRNLLLSALAAVIAALIASPMLLGAREYSKFSIRAAGDDPETEHQVFDVHGWNLLQQLSVYSGVTNYDGMRAAGAIVMIFALVGLSFFWRNDMAVFVLLFVVLLDCSLLSPYWIGDFLIRVAPYKMGSPARAMLLGSLPLAMLAGAGVDSLFKAEASARSKAFRTALVSVIAALVLYGLYRAVNPHPFLDIGLEALVAPALAVGLAVAFLWLRFPAWTAAIPVMILILAEALFWSRYRIPWDMRGPYFPRDPQWLAQSFDFWTDNTRRFDPQPNLYMYALDGVVNGNDPLHVYDVRRLMTKPMPHEEFKRWVYPYELVAYSNRGNSFLKRPFWLAREYVRGPVPDLPRQFPPTTTVYLADPPELAVPEVEPDRVPNRPFADGRNEVAVSTRTMRFTPDRRPSEDRPLTWASQVAFPPVHKVLSLRLRSDTRAVLQLGVHDPDTKERLITGVVQVAPTSGLVMRYDVPLPDIDKPVLGLVVEFLQDGTIELERVGVVLDEADENEKIHIIERTANAVEVRLEDLPGDRILVFVDSWYPGWRAYVDGERVPIMKADSAFKAVAVPSGTHTVRFVFRPTPVSAGMAASGITLVLVFTTITFALFRRQRA